MWIVNSKGEVWKEIRRRKRKLKKKKLPFMDEVRIPIKANK